MTDPQWMLVVDVIKALAWPIAVIFLGLFFRSEIRALLPRLRRAGPVELDPLREQQQAETPKPEVPTQPPGPASEVVLSTEQTIRQQLQSRRPEERETTLIRALAETRLAAFFENTYGLIFGSQILGLRRLNGYDSVPVDDARGFFEENARKLYPNEYSNTDFDAWISFLVARGLVTRDHEKVAITEMGREFLQFISKMRMPENKAL